VVQITLFIHIISNGIRSVVLFIDPIFSQRVFLYEISTFVNTITFPLETITLLLIAFYWFTLIDDSHIGVYSFLGTFSIPFGISGAIILIQEIVGGIIRILNIPEGLQFIIILNAVLYLIIVVPSTIFFFILGFIVLGKTKELTSQTAKDLRRITVRIMVSGIFLILWLIPIILTVTNLLFVTPEAYSTIWFFLYGFLLISSLVQLSALQSPRKRNPNTKSKNSKSKKSKISKKDSEEDVEDDDL